jgi:hypothetical protein
MGDRGVLFGLLVQRPVGKKPFGKTRHRLIDNIKVHLKEVSGGMEWIDLFQDREKWQALVNAVINLRFLRTRNFLPT